MYSSVVVFIKGGNTALGVKDEWVEPSMDTLNGALLVSSWP